MKCKICGVSCRDYRCLGVHIRLIHNISTESYYNKHIKKNAKEGKCLMCGKKTAFLGLHYGYQPYCCFRCACDSPLKQEHTENTNLKRKGVRCVFQAEDVKRKIKRTLRKTLGVDNVSKDPRIIRKIKKTKKDRYGDENYNNRPKAKKTCKELFGYEIASQSPKIKKLTANNNLENWGYISTALHPDVKRKQKRTLNKHYKVTSSPFASKVIQEKSRISRRKHTGFDYTLQDPKMLKRVLQKKRKELHGYDSGSEKSFAKLLRHENIRFRSHIDIYKNDLKHQFDFAIFKNNKLNCLVEIDGEYFHGINNDCDGKYIRGDKDYIRWNIVPNNIKFLVIDSLKMNEGLNELKRILKMSYDRWLEEMLTSIPKHIEDAFPSFSDNRMRNDYLKLCSYKQFRNNSFIGKSILLNFCKSRLCSLKDDWMYLRTTLYKSPCSSHHLFEGFNLFKNTCILKTKYKDKYKNDNIVIVKHHSPEKMLAICSLGKLYVSKEPIDSESKNIIKFLNLSAYELL